jgi:hypothetical protein
MEFGDFVDAEAERKVTLLSSKNPELRHPTTGAIQPLQAEHHDDASTLSLHWEPYQGYMIVFRNR